MKDNDKVDKSGKHRNKKRRTYGKKERNEGNHRRIEGKEDFVDKSNDPSWYAATPQLMQDAASLSFSNALGCPVTINIDLEGWSGYEKAIPGVMAIHTRPTIGCANSWTDPINIAARNIYSFVRHANSGHSNYDAPNLMMYLLACDGVFSMYAFLMRLYGIMMSYSMRNRYMPRALVEAMGINFDSIYNNLANLRYSINMYVQKAGTLCVPSSMMYFMRHIWMYSNIYADAPSTKAQLYMYTPETLFGYLEAGVAGFPKPVVSQVHIVDGTGATKLTFGQLMAKADAMINGILTSEDLNIMAGDILKAYGSDKLWKMAVVPETYQIVPTFSPEVLTQIHNLTVVGSESTLYDGMDSFYIYENTNEGDPNAGALTCNPSIEGEVVHLMADKILDLPMESPSPSDVMVASRLMVYGEVVTRVDGTKGTRLKVLGSEVATCIHIHRYSVESGRLVLENTIFGHRSGVGSPTYSFIYQVEKFGMHPILYTLENANFKIGDIIGDVDNYTIVHKDTLDKMHQTALMSMLNVPLMGVATVK